MVIVLDLLFAVIGVLMYALAWNWPVSSIAAIIPKAIQMGY